MNNLLVDYISVNYYYFIFQISVAPDKLLIEQPLEQMTTEDKMAVQEVRKCIDLSTLSLQRFVLVKKMFCEGQKSSFDCTVGARIPNTRKPNPFENRTF